MIEYCDWLGENVRWRNEQHGTVRRRALSAEKAELAWAAGVWTRACDARDEHVAAHAIVSLSEPEARERLRSAGID